MPITSADLFLSIETAWDIAPNDTSSFAISVTGLISRIAGPANDLDFPGETTTQSNLLNRFAIAHSSITSAKYSSDISAAFRERRLIKHHIPIKEKFGNL
ncbi:hypothetical protein [Burkholderia pseudomallei]|uniref:hypothetical protein n=1 Tax=Burkholderia pseudomallei TaxID=28450 RepID=UPI001604C815|nr:hypothetical protein [Burkholderia pseudomallei]